MGAHRHRFWWDRTHSVVQTLHLCRISTLALQESAVPAQNLIPASSEKPDVKRDLVLFTSSDPFSGFEKC